ncbi:MAG: ribosome biogenesis GTP-binding protein YihA/YsxC [Bacteroidetes bacterium]|jgi:GTP-binding protein|nr:ribosome biogenesis GTP-binding protein YihA/YsxC [Bacteroidota bacterium]MDF1866161.1 ribosome biogenesis GTP-binding protein YihA/YsxC [Saprospiraceae bacterium]
MEINTSKYLASYPRIEACPPPNKPEYAFIGRSNVGKSSLINMLCKRKGMALTSKKPGKTQMINYFLINELWNLVDLPGYGYAVISKKRRAKWEIMIANYLKQRESLMCTFVLIDCNIPPQKIDIEFINQLGKWGVPFAIVYTKADKLKKLERKKNVKNFQEEILKYWNALPQEFTTSSDSGLGRTEILEFISEINRQYFSKPKLIKKK